MELLGMEFFTMDWYSLFAHLLTIINLLTHAIAPHIHPKLALVVVGLSKAALQYYAALIGYTIIQPFCNDLCAMVFVPLWLIIFDYAYNKAFPRRNNELRTLGIWVVVAMIDTIFPREIARLLIYVFLKKYDI